MCVIVFGDVEAKALLICKSDSTSVDLVLVFMHSVGHGGFQRQFVKRSIFTLLLTLFSFSGTSAIKGYAAVWKMHRVASSSEKRPLLCSRNNNTMVI